MRTSVFGVLLFSVSACTAADFAIKSVTVPPNVATQGAVFIEVVGDFPSNVKTGAAWTLKATDHTTKQTYAPVVKSVVGPELGLLTLVFDPLELKQAKAEDLDWQASLGPVTSPPPPPQSPGISLFGTRFGSARSKEDADLYLFGSFLAGGSTKPIYTIDAKLNWKLMEIGNPSWFLGLSGTLSTNANATPPTDRSRIDPDSVTGAVTVHTRVGPTQEIALDFNPVRGEFSRKTATSDIVTTGMAKYIGWSGDDAGVGYALYPSVGYELGHNLNKPGTIYGQSVDFSRYNAIVRGVAAAHGELLFFKPKPTASDTYLLTLQADYTARPLLEPEPFVTAAYAGSKHITPVSVRSNTRHYVEIGISYNPSPYLALTAKYKWGSLPPLFQYVDHQVVIGVTFSAKQQ